MYQNFKNHPVAFCTRIVEASWNVMAQAQKPDFVFRRKGRVHLNRRGASVQSTTCSRGVRISGSNAGYIMFWGSVKGTGYPLHSPVSPSLPFPRVTVCHHISAGVYHLIFIHHDTCLSKIWLQSHVWYLTEPNSLYTIVCRLRMTYYRPKHVATLKFLKDSVVFKAFTATPFS